MNLSTFGQYYSHPMMGYDGWGWGIMMLFWMALFVVGVIIAIRLLNKNDTSAEGHKVDPLSIIKERYAKGEITKEQFTQLKKDLSSR